MADERIQTLRAQANAENTVEAWLSLENALVRAGESGAETFQPVLALSDAGDTDEDMVRADLYRWANVVRKGDLVRYSNKRARAKFKSGPREGQKVPVGEVGEVFWVGDAYAGGYSYGIKTEDESKFFSAEKNFDESPLNAWGKVQTRLSHEAYVDSCFPGPVPGVYFPHANRVMGKAVVLDGVEGYIFWSSWVAGALRIGVKREADRNKRGAPVVWGTIVDATPVGEQGRMETK